jgi:hypothetical protein
MASCGAVQLERTKWQGLHACLLPVEAACHSSNPIFTHASTRSGAAALAPCLCGPYSPGSPAVMLIDPSIRDKVLLPLIAFVVIFTLMRGYLFRLLTPPPDAQIHADELKQKCVVPRLRWCRCYGIWSICCDCALVRCSGDSSRACTDAMQEHPGSGNQITRQHAVHQQRWGRDAPRLAAGPNHRGSQAGGCTGV